MKIDLASMARQSGIRRKTVILRPIKPVVTLENDLYAIYAISQSIWAKLARVVLDGFQLPTITTDADGAQLGWLVDQASRQADNTLIYQTERLGRWVTRVGIWHGSRTISGVKSALGVEIEPFIRLGDVRELLDVSVRANVALISSVNAQNRSAIEAIIYDGFANRRTKKYMADALSAALGVTKKRARLIANDQIYKLGIGLTAYRNQQLGILGYDWETQRDSHVRHTHRLRQGKRFLWSKPPPDGHPGYPVGCRCWAVSVVELG